MVDTVGRTDGGSEASTNKKKSAPVTCHFLCKKYLSLSTDFCCHVIKNDVVNQKCQIGRSMKVHEVTQT